MQTKGKKTFNHRIITLEPVERTYVKLIHGLDVKESQFCLKEKEEEASSTENVPNLTPLRKRLVRKQDKTRQLIKTKKVLCQVLFEGVLEL